MPSACNTDFVDDIEDLISGSKDGESNGIVDSNRAGNKSFILPYGLKKSKNLSDEQVRAEVELIKQMKAKDPNSRSNVPGVASIYVKTWGCTHNSSDSEYMAGQLASYGYTICDEPEQADLWLLNSCTVKNPAEDHFKNFIESARKTDKYLVVAGCVPQGAPKAAYIKGLSVIGVQQIDRIVEVVEETLKGNSVRLFGKKKRDNKKYGGAPLSLPKVRRNPLIEIVAINTGCLNECTYCKTKHARGELGSYQPAEIVERIKHSFTEGVKEIWLTSEDTGAYGRDIGTNIVELLWKIVEVIPEDCMLRIGMTNPPYILEHLEQITLVMQHPRVYAFLHVPIQSGSDMVLADMKREYSVDDFEHIVDFLREKVPGVNILTDVICGFPTETEQDFQLTMDLIRKYKFASLFINQFFQRPGTPAAKMQQVPTQERKRRTRIVSELFQSYTTHEHRLGERCQVLVTELSHDKEHYVGHNKFYEQVLVPKIDSLMGHMIEVDIVECTKFSMKGNLVNEPPKESALPAFPSFEAQKMLQSQTETNGIQTSCCGNETEGVEQEQEQDKCCGGSSSKEGGCIDNNNNNIISSSRTEPFAAQQQDQQREKRRNYAYATLAAFGVILASRIALRVLYPK